MDVNRTLQTRMLRRAVARSRYENATLREIRTLMRAAGQSIIQAVRSAGIHAQTPVGLPRLARNGVTQHQDQRERLAALLREVTRIWLAAVQQARTRLQTDLLDYAELDLAELPQEIQAILTRALTAAPLTEAAEDFDTLFDPFIPPSVIGLSFTEVPSAQVAHLLTSPLGGATFTQAFEDLSTRVLARLRNVLSGGLLRGEGVPRVARAVQGVMGNLRWEAERIVRSEYVRTAAQSALIQFDQNSPLLRGVQWVATLDAQTCLQCGKLDGRVWDDPSDALVPTVNTHPNCRCVIVPVIKNSKELFLEPSTRASFTGQVPDTLTYPEWFAQQDAAFQRETLGPTRYRLFASGQLTLGDFATAAGVRSVADALALARRR